MKEKIIDITPLDKVNPKVRLVLAQVVSIVVAAILYYIALPAMNLQSGGFYTYWFLVLGVFYLNNFFATMTMPVTKQSGAIKKIQRVVVVVAILMVVVVLGGALCSATFFRARAFSNIISVREAVFEEEMPETTSVNNIALMDSESARIIGNRALGNLSEVVSQYTLSTQYTQINYKNAPKKVAVLEYDGFFKWVNNNQNGIPGYVCVDPVANTATYNVLSTPMTYAESAYFGENLHRKLRFEYPTKIFGSCYFEIDDEGNPYYIVSCLQSTVGLFGAKDVKEVILFNPCDGSSVLYAVDQVPSWVDIVFSGDLATQKYNWYGTLSGGFWNSLIGNKNCKIATDDYGYIVIDDDVWYFTGVTSVTSDKSNIGFIITNARTGEYRFYPVVGAEEYSAMSAAQGEVQEKGYVASFPSLVNIAGNATYIMVLKDSGGLVKLYALVNVENYGIVATGATQAEVITAYKKLLKANGEDVVSDDLKTEKITVSDVRLVTLDGAPIIYITDENGNVYKGVLSADESLILIRVGDSITVTFDNTEIADLYELESWQR